MCRNGVRCLRQKLVEFEFRGVSWLVERKQMLRDGTWFLNSKLCVSNCMKIQKYHIFDICDRYKFDGSKKNVDEMVGFVWVHNKTWREGLVQRLVHGLIDNFARKWISDLECPKACSGLEYKSVELFILEKQRNTHRIIQPSKFPLIYSI